MALNIGNLFGAIAGNAMRQNPLLRVLQSLGQPTQGVTGNFPSAPTPVQPPTDTGYRDPMISNQTTGRKTKTSMGEQYAYNYFLKKNINPAAAAGIVGNMAQESAFRDDVLTGKRMGDNGASGYAAQWQGKRLANLMAFANARGETTPSLNTQLDFVLEEGNPQSPYADQGAVKAMQMLANVNDVGQASDIFRTHFERPSAPDAARRRAHAYRVAGVQPDPNFVADSGAGQKQTPLMRVLGAATGTPAVTPGAAPTGTQQPQTAIQRIMASIAQPSPSPGGGMQAQQGGGQEQAPPAVDTGEEEIAGLQQQLAQASATPRQSALERRKQLTAKTRYQA